MTNFERVAKTKKELAKFLSGIAITHGCANCPARAYGCNAKSCEQKWEKWLDEMKYASVSNFSWITTCPEELADFIAYELGIECECSVCPAFPCADDAFECWSTISDWLEKEVEK